MFKRMFQRSTSGLLVVSITLLLAATAAALPITARVGSGDAAAKVLVEFDSGDEYLFEVSFDSMTLTSGLDLLKVVDAEVAGFDIVLLDFGFGEFVDGISFLGNDNYGYVAPDGWWHYWTGDVQTGEWTESQVGAGDRLVSDGDWDGWRWGSPDPPSLRAGKEAPLLGALGQLSMAGGLAFIGVRRLRPH
jgi:hypothetical protein